MVLGSRQIDVSHLLPFLASISVEVDPDVKLFGSKVDFGSTRTGTIGSRRSGSMGPVVAVASGSMSSSSRPCFCSHVCGHLVHVHVCCSFLAIDSCVTCSCSCSVAVACVLMLLVLALLLLLLTNRLGTSGAAEGSPS